jgi:hypothetical protein
MVYMIIITIIASTLIIIIHWDVKFPLQAIPVPKNDMEHLGAVVTL